MKNIYILGVPRSGKTTFSILLKEELENYSLLSLDAIRNAFHYSLPELEMINRQSYSRKYILPRFVAELVHWNHDISKNACIVEGGLINLEDIIGQVRSDDIVICFGHGSHPLEEVVEKIKEFDTKEDYTYGWSKEKLMNHYYDLCDTDLENRKICLQKKYYYIDTFENRDEIFSKLLKEIKKCCK